MFLEKRENNALNGYLTLNGFSLDCVKELKHLGVALTAELLCIAQAVSCICNNKILSSNFLICSDSLSSLWALNNINSQNKQIVKTHINLNFLRSRGVQVFFSFVRGHTGIYGNERADWLAKEATKLSDLIPMSIPKSYHKKVFNEKIISEWTNLYQISNNAHLTKEFIPSIQRRLKAKHFHPNFKLTLFLTGHGNFKAYLKRFNLSPTLTSVLAPVTQSRMPSTGFLLVLNSLQKDIHS
ncbi:uncharacterized protein TNCV_2230201 [Trichonephila clavipes]|uniref:RNase H type-1 domain-containing protein n=1 Tax=Trichonephila clavipes TaxID=2585209 RepID=A0A8X6WDY7_TRICX|nr:uncharacterized protein TNCV_2230201 [Trichonephila clavipes]